MNPGGRALTRLRMRYSRLGSLRYGAEVKPDALVPVHGKAAARRPLLVEMGWAATNPPTTWHPERKAACVLWTQPLGYA